MRRPWPTRGCWAWKKNSGSIKSDVYTSFLRSVTSLELICSRTITVNYLLPTHGGCRSPGPCTTTLPSQLESNSNFTLALSISICLLRADYNGEQHWQFGLCNVHSVQQKSIVLKFSKSQTGSDVRYSCHHNSSRFISPYLRIRGVSLSSIRYNPSHRVYINRRQQYICLIWN